MSEKPRSFDSVIPAIQETHTKQEALTRPAESEPKEKWMKYLAYLQERERDLKKLEAEGIENATEALETTNDEIVSVTEKIESLLGMDR